MSMTDMEWKAAKKGIKRYFSTAGWALLFYHWIVNLSVVGAMVVEVAGNVIRGFVTGDFASIEKAVMQASENAWGFFVAAAIGLLLLLIWKKPRYFKEEIFARGAPMDAGSFFTLLCIVVSGQLVYLIGSTALELALNAFGYTITAGIESLQSNPDNFSVFLYGCILAPITEEILFRGLIQRTMLPFGKKFAILISSLTFGLFHGNLLQLPYAFAVGLVLGYVAVEYNILWSMVLHMINNLVLGDILYRVLDTLPLETANTIIWGVVLAFSVAAVILIIAKRNEIAAWLRSDRIIGAYAGCYFSCLGTIAMLLVMSASTVIVTHEMITPI